MKYKPHTTVFSPEMEAELAAYIKTRAGILIRNVLINMPKKPAKWQSWVDNQMDG